jgi:hypothetical protein
MTERKPPGTSWESWVDAQIARGLARGDFDDLPGAGKPLPRRSGDETVYDWVVNWARKENVDVLGMLPPGLALRKEREGLPARAAQLPSEPAVRALVDDFNDRVRLFWRRPQEGPTVVVGLADVDAVLDRWRSGRPPAPAPAPEPLPTATPERRRWLARWRSRRRG